MKAPRSKPNLKNEQIEEILEFWFGDLDADDTPVANDKNKQWFSSTKASDQKIAELFGADLDAAISGRLDHWTETPRGRLALVIILDQFSRTILRGTDKAFANDERARALCLRGIELGADRALRPFERAFLYMPLMHSEDLVEQTQGVEMFTVLAKESPLGLRSSFDSFADYAVRHRRVVEMFGRFPHRNAVLGRTSTADEEAYLAKGKWF